MKCEFMFVAFFVFLFGNAIGQLEEKSVKDAIAFFKSETTKMISDLNDRNHTLPSQVQAKVRKLAQELHFYFDELEKYTKSSDYSKNKNNKAKQNGKYAKKFAKFRDQYLNLKSLINSGLQSVDSAQQPEVGFSGKKETVRKENKDEEKMEQIMESPLEIIFYTGVTVIVFMIAVSWFTRRYGISLKNGPKVSTLTNNVEDGVINPDMDKYFSKIENQINELNGLVTDRFGSLEKKMDVVTSKLNKIDEATSKDKLGEDKSKIMNNDVPENPEVPIDFSTGAENRTEKNRGDAGKQTEDSTKSRKYKFENLKEAQEIYVNPVFVLDDEGKYLIDEQTGEMRVDNKIINDFDMSSLISTLKHSFAVSGNSVGCVSFEIRRPAKVKKEGGKWQLESIGELELK